MADFDVEYVGDTPGDIQNRLAKTATTGRRRVNNALRDTAEEVKNDLEASSPEDTGEYKSSWYIFPVKEDEVWILNEADHAKFVMLPNSKMVNASGADLPASGVLHNVKGRAKKHSESYKQNMIEELKEFFSDISIK